MVEVEGDKHGAWEDALQPTHMLIVVVGYHLLERLYVGSGRFSCSLADFSKLRVQKRAATYILSVGAEKHVSLYSMEWKNVWIGQLGY